MRADRLSVGTLCKHTDFNGDSTVCLVVGTWSFTGNRGIPGQTETRERRFRQDPQTDESGNGYLLLPSGDTGFIYATWGDVATGDLTSIT